MITIGNEKANIKDITSKYPLNNIQRNIIDILNSSKTVYRYDTLEELIFELMLRNEIIRAAEDLNNSKFEFEVFEKSRCNTKCWYRLDDGGFALKSWVSPSDAIQDIFINSHLYATECSTAMTIILYKSLLSVFKKSLFNRLFHNIRLRNWHYLDKLILDIKHMKKYSDYLPGDRRYVKNPDFSPSDPECQGQNIIDMGYGHYYGHGIGITDIKNIISELNKCRRRRASKSAYLVDTAARPNFKKLSYIYYNK